MRAAFCLLLALTAASPVLAQGRYGPEPVGNRAGGMPSNYGGRTLTWAGKTQPVPVVAPPVVYTPLANGVMQGTSLSTIMPAPQPAPPAPAAAPGPVVAENAPWRRLTGQALQPAAPMQPARPAAAPAQPDQPNAPAARPTTPIPAPGALAPAAPGPQASAAPPAASEADQARFYSLHRQYGETPDHIAIPEKSQVFLAGGPLGAGVDGGLDDPDDGGTGKTAATKKAMAAADWQTSSSTPAVERVYIRRP